MDCRAGERPAAGLRRVAPGPGVGQAEQMLSRYLTFTRAEWAERPGAGGPVSTKRAPLSEADLRALQGINEGLSLAEVAEVYEPLSCLLHIHVAAARDLHAATARFLGLEAA